MQNKNSYGLKINLLSLDGASVATLRGQHSTKPCVIIPIESGLYQGERGIYLNLNAVPRTDLPTNGWSHILRLNIPQEKYKAMDANQRSAIPSVGLMRQIGARLRNDITTDQDTLELSDPSQLNF